MQAFTDLVGTATLPIHGFDIAELTELTPALDMATAVHDMAAQASEARNSGTWARSACPCPFDCN